MCEHCYEPSRRELLKGAVLGLAAAVMAGCPPETPLNELPNAYEEHVPDESGVRPKVDESKIVVPATQRPQVSDYGAIMARSAWTTTPLALRGATAIGGVTKVTIHHSGDGKAFLPASAADVATVVTRSARRSFFIRTGLVPGSNDNHACGAMPGVTQSFTPCSPVRKCSREPC